MKGTPGSIQLVRLALLGGIAVVTSASAHGGTAIADSGANVVTDAGSVAHMLLTTPAQQQIIQHMKSPSSDFACTPGNLVYDTANNGPVMRNPTNYLIFWQPPGRAAFPAGYQAAMERYFQTIGGTPLYNIVTEYNDTSGNPIPNSASLGAPSFTDTTTAPPSGCNGSVGAVGATPNCPLTDGDIQAEVTHALAVNTTWARPSVNIEYFVFTPSDVDECNGPDSDGTGNQDCFGITGGPGLNEYNKFCAYHSSFGGNTVYAFMPFASNDQGGGCHGSLINFPNGAANDVELTAVSHEMIESNTDPLITAWDSDGCGNEIGDKCNRFFLFASPDGVNMVLNGSRFQIQSEFSNDVSACSKRYGPTPTTLPPLSVAFGEVEVGATAEEDVTIQNNGSGDLNILNIRLGIGSDPSYSLLNPAPIAGTIHSSESITVQVKFTPSSALVFNPTAAVEIDTDDPAQTTYTTSVTGTVGVKPTARCHNVVVSTDLNLCSNANASINNFSFDPDGEAITLAQTPAGPYTLGTTNVTLLVTDTGTDQRTASCTGTIGVKDTQLPMITCPPPQSVVCTSASGAPDTITPTFSDNCPGVTAACVPPSGSTFGFGTTPVSCTATDGSGNMSSCATSVTVTDVPPVISSIVASPNVLRPPNKKLDPVRILVTETDLCDPGSVCSITSVTTNSGPAPAGSYVITGPLSLKLQAAGNGGHALTYIIGVTSADHHGGATTGQTTVQAPL